MRLRYLGVATYVAIIAGLSGACGGDVPPGTPYVPTAATGGSPPVGAAGTAGTAKPPVLTAGTGGVGIPPLATGGTPSVIIPPAAGTGALPPDAGAKIPCGPERVLKANCQNCHGAQLLFGAPMPLVTHADLMKMSRSQPTKNVAQVAALRMIDASNPMPPSSQKAMVATDKTMLQTWLEGGAKVATTAADLQCADTVDSSGTGYRHSSPATHDLAYFQNGLTEKPGEKCYEFQVHGRTGVTDATPYPVKTGEHYVQFYFKAPWGPDTVMTRYGTKFNNVQSVHHWLFFTTNRPESQAGTFGETVGTTLGEDSQLLAGWAVGGDHVEFPGDTGLELPSGGMINVQWHYFNQGTAPQTDTSRVQICTMPKSSVKNVASLTFLGTENFNGPLGMPAKTESKFTSTCTNDSGAPIFIYGFNPHMHKLGRHMTANILRVDGKKEVAYDGAFDFNSQITYILDKLIELKPGDKIESTCTFFNDTDRSVAFGESTNSEMCYNFTMSYPAKALDNGVISLIGATNTCW
ncbi:MAG: hypothetical protein RL701_22 [Pseudomonadota bacterium]